MANSKASKSKKKSTTSVKTTTIEATSKSTGLGSISSSVNTYLRKMKKMPIIGASVAEFIGTFLLITAFLQMQGNPLFVGFALAGTVLVVGGVAGAHLNPATTIGAWVTRKISTLRALFYIIAQLLGAVSSWFILDAFSKAASTTATPIFHAATLTADKEWYIFFAELIGVTVVTFGAAAALKNKKDKLASAFTYGFALLTALYIAMSLTTALLTEQGTTLSLLNPAIAAVTSSLSWNIWPIAVYIFAPVLGGILGFVLQDFLGSQTTEEKN